MQSSKTKLKPAKRNATVSQTVAPRHRGSRESAGARFSRESCEGGLQGRERVLGLRLTGIIPRELGLLTATVWLQPEYPRELKLPDAAHTCPGGLCGIETTSGRTVAPARSLSRRTGIRAGAEPYKSGRHGAACGPQWTRKLKQRATERLIGREFRARSVMLEATMRRFRMAWRRH